MRAPQSPLHLPVRNPWSIPEMSSSDRKTTNDATKYLDENPLDEKSTRFQYLMFNKNPIFAPWIQEISVFYIAKM